MIHPSAGPQQLSVLAVVENGHREVVVEAGRGTVRERVQAGRPSLISLAALALMIISNASRNRS
jgi:hypothetical protein